MSSPAYESARQAYIDLGVDTEAALAAAAGLPLSLHCWQGDDGGGFENLRAGLNAGGVPAAGNYPGKARSPKELRQDLEQALKLLPGRHRLNLHASYAESGGETVDRNALLPEHFQGWIDWCREQKLGLDFNPAFFAHRLADEGWTLSHPDPSVRGFWIEHGMACRKIGAEMGRQLGSPTVTNVWIPDGSKDSPVDRKGPRERLLQSLDAVFSEQFEDAVLLDAVESKLSGIGAESYVAGSHEFYLGYAITRGKIYCLDTSHLHPGENSADQVSSLLQFVPRLLLHLRRGTHRDGGHVVLFDDATCALMDELVRGEFLHRVHLAMDFFDASINRIAAWVIGARATRQALLLALLQPLARLRELEANGDFTGRLALLEETKTLPFSTIWDEFCRRHNVPAGLKWLDEVKRYEAQVLALRR
jgi:L-rhamnose isomerase